MALNSGVKYIILCGVRGLFCFVFLERGISHL